MTNALHDITAVQPVSRFKIRPAKIRRWSWRRRKAWYVRTAPTTLRSGISQCLFDTEEIPIRFCGWMLTKDGLGRAIMVADIVSFVADPATSRRNNG